MDCEVWCSFQREVFTSSSFADFADFVENSPTGQKLRRAQQKAVAKEGPDCAVHYAAYQSPQYIFTRNACRACMSPESANISYHAFGAHGYYHATCCGEGELALNSRKRLKQHCLRHARAHDVYYASCAILRTFGSHRAKPVSVNTWVSTCRCRFPNKSSQSWHAEPCYLLP